MEYEKDIKIRTKSFAVRVVKLTNELKTKKYRLSIKRSIFKKRNFCRSECKRGESQ